MVEGLVKTGGRDVSWPRREARGVLGAHLNFASNVLPEVREESERERKETVPFPIAHDFVTMP